MHSDVALGITLVSVEGKVVRLSARLLAPHAVCPTCETPSSQIHDRYVRRPMDLPWRGHTVRFSLTVRRFRCLNPACPRLTFTESPGGLLSRHAQRTAAATQTLLALAHADGGEGGARVARRMGLPVSPDTLLRLLRSQQTETPPTPRVLGVDDFALRRRHRYATLLVDLETHEPIDLLDGREAEVLASWLRAHEGVEIVVRDRAEAYAEGAAQGAPDAQQVADRFHLLQNASEALEEVLRGRRRAIERAEDEAVADPAEPAPTKAPSRREQERARRRARRVERGRKVRELREAGGSISGIAREMGMDRRTVRYYLATPEAPRRQAKNPRPQGFASPTLQPFQAYLQDRWEQGCTNISQLYRELVGRGYTGSRSLLNTVLLPWRPPRKTQRAKKRRVSVRWLCLRPPDHLDDWESELLDQILADDPGLAQGYELLQRFRRLITSERSIAALDQWLAEAQASKLVPFAAMAKGLIGDRSAVEAALTTEWSTGPVEGHIHRVKLIKRSGYGRYRLDLLRRRVLAA